MIDCWTVLCQHDKHSSENMTGRQLVYEAESYSLCRHCVKWNQFQNVLGNLQWRVLTRICIYVEKLGSLISILLSEFLLSRKVVTAETICVTEKFFILQVQGSTATNLLAVIKCLIHGPMKFCDLWAMFQNHQRKYILNTVSIQDIIWILVR
jgi:hypothetical protein